MDILTRMRNTTAADLENISGDMSALVSKPYTPKVDKGMIRIVEGADDLVHPNAGQGGNDGTSVAQDWSDRPEIPASYATSSNGAEGVIDRRSPRQVELMDSLHLQLADLDGETAGLAVDYTTRMTLQGKWTPGRDGNASAWIGRMITKVRELKNAPRTAPVPAPAAVDIPAIEWKRFDKNNKPMCQYFAVEIDGTTKFYRIKPGTKPGWWWVDAQASDAMYPVRNVATKTAIIKAITDHGVTACMEAYGRLIGSCGRCGRTLTDETSRAKGIGPDCEGKM
jgi:hypothetical protein